MLGAMTGRAPEHRSIAVDRQQQSTAVPDAALRDLADRQHGVVSRRQITAAGLTPAMIRTRLERGSLIRIHRGVYAVGHRRLRPQGTSLAALLAVGRGAVLSHRDAAGLHQLRPANHRDSEVTIDAKRAPIDGIRIHRAILPPDEVTRIDGLPVTTVARTLVDLACVVPKDHLAKAVQQAERLRSFDGRAVERALARTRNRHGTGHAALTALLAELRGIETQLTRSTLEIRFLALVDRYGLPRPRTNLHVHGREVDAWWPRARLAVEADGWRDHGTRVVFQRDREKGNWLALRGITLLRFTHDDVMRRPERVAAQLAEALANREHRAA
ncbi:type IV toxin-antitoxin system AbiEi family antitoxin domain-containing protein [Conexibacter stalactiti]|uniref:Type IV toxin-antitoxin system AbiEi family antitoxin domain-containing protein n=1 Tax=Conexibacter stalactiti TaxID=1940611 RepID=A0ABU4HSG1_9ACTN|nr:type IV toxin-antitoxin system AbiEi family antitoxin domain-containing protein [Conexibacter stalactiti]MDW5596231.1 type IV toxin-antitoxin system AbiEi family antitoxin domain-containing protein [Conexibacter stalactiti]MEC5036873.1 type IV toxin-antitoxin system AbiEi family antitoxin domain-containing protein [Conexibacter stalactiti]